MVKPLLLRTLLLISCFFLPDILLADSGFSGAVAQDSASLRWHQWRKGRDQYPLAAWAYFSKFEGSRKEYDFYKEAGLNLVMAPFDQYQTAVDAGLDVLIGGWEKLHEYPGRLANRVKFSNKEGERVAGYILRDEPHLPIYPKLSQAIDYIYNNDTSTAIPIIDQFPDWSVLYERFGMDYETLINKFADEVKPPVLLNCHYPALSDNSDRPGYYYNVEMFRKKALEKNIGLMGFALVTPHWDIYLRPSESVLRWPIWSYLAYGAKGIWYYNWRINEKGFGDGMIWGDRIEPTPSYELVKNINSEILAVGKTLLKLRSKAVFHTGQAIPHGTTRYADGSISALAFFQGPDFVLGELINQDENQDESTYLVMVNKSHHKDFDSVELSRVATFSAADGYCVYLYDKVSGGQNLLEPENGKYYLKIGGGDGQLLRFVKTPVDEFVSTASEIWQGWIKGRKQFPIAAWTLGTDKPLSEKMLKLYKKANMTMIFSAGQQIEDVTGFGLELIVGPNDLSSSQIPTACLLKHEPKPGDFNSLADSYKKMYEQNSKVLPIVDLFPNWYGDYTRLRMNYDKYVKAFIDKVHPPVIMHTHFPTMADGTDRPWYYANLELFAQLGRKYRIGLMGNIMTVGHGQRYRKPSESDIYWQVYSHLAYGAKGIWYYSWQRPTQDCDDGFVSGVKWYPAKMADKDNITGGFIDSQNGKCTDTYQIVKKINKEILTLSPVLLNLQSIAVFHTGKDIPIGTEKYTDGAIAAITKVKGDNFLIGVFDNKQDDADAVYLMVVNKRHGMDLEKQELKAQFSFSITNSYNSVTMINVDTGKKEKIKSNAENTCSLSIDGGQGVLLRLEK